MKTIYLILFLLYVGSFSLSAQSIYYNHGSDNFLRAEFNRPVFESFANADFLSFDLFLNGEFRVGKKNKISFEIPFSRSSFDTGVGLATTSGLGNLALGFQIRDLESPNYLEFKLRLPTMDDNNFGLFTDYTERLASLIPNFISFEAKYNLESAKTIGLYYRFKPGLKLLISTNDSSFNDDLELFLDINLLGGYRTNFFDVNAGIASTSIITEQDIDIRDRVLDQLFATFTYTASSIKPGIIIRVPLDDVGFDHDIVLGVHMSYIFGTKPSAIDRQ